MGNNCLSLVLRYKKRREKDGNRMYLGKTKTVGRIAGAFPGYLAAG